MAKAANRVGSSLKPAYAYVGLAWRPTSLAITVLLIAYAAAVAVAVPRDNGFDTFIDAWCAGRGTPDVIDSLWRATIVVPLCVGIAIQLMTADLDAALFVWSIPSVRRQLFGGALGVAVLVAGATVAAHWPLSDGTTIFAAAGAASATFAVGVTFGKRFVLVRMRWALAIAVGLAIIYPAALIRVVGLGPLPFALLSIVGTVLLLRESLSVGVWRACRLIASNDAPDALRNRLLGVDADGALYHRCSVHGTRAWLQTTRYAWSGNGRGSWLRVAFIVACVGAATAYTTNGLWFLGLMGTIAFAQPKVGVRGCLLYPLSRRQRATLLFMDNAIQLSIFMAIGGTLAFGLFRFHPWPQMPGDSPVVPARDIASALCIALAWIPLAQWLNVQPPRPDQTKHVDGNRPWTGIPLSSLVTVIGLTISLKAYNTTFAPPPGPTGFAVIALSILIVHTTFYLGLRRSYARKDLV